MTQNVIQYITFKQYNLGDGGNSEGVCNRVKQKQLLSITIIWPLPCLLLGTMEPFTHWSSLFGSQFQLIYGWASLVYYGDRPTHPGLRMWAFSENVRYMTHFPTSHSRNFNLSPNCLSIFHSFIFNWIMTCLWTSMIESIKLLTNLSVRTIGCISSVGAPATHHFSGVHISLPVITRCGMYPCIAMDDCMANNTRGNFLSQTFPVEFITFHRAIFRVLLEHSTRPEL